jgi:D-alanyl-D-alanine carboxypeptidase/D-alanyl-D-alanine-endopeptidase (penicillin-binding protein 4)
VSGGDDVLAPLRSWADSVRSRGIRVIEGRVRGQADYFPDAVLGEGWMWDDLPYHYAAPVGALQFNESAAVLEVAAGPASGDPVRLTLRPSSAPIRLFSTATTAPPDSDVSSLQFTRQPFGDSVAVWGRISRRRSPSRLVVSLPDPTRYFEAALTQALREAGIAVLERPPASSASASSAGDTLFAWESIPLSELLPHFQKPSQNQIGESLLRTLGVTQGGVASVDSGRAALREVLRSFGVPDDAYLVADGSGVSHYNYLAPDAIARTLLAMSRREDFEAFLSALPVAGVDGTLAGRMRGGPAAGNARAKTGTIGGASTLSGYVTTADGERLAFVLMCNHFTVPTRIVTTAQDRMVERLAAWGRRGGPR